MTHNIVDGLHHLAVALAELHEDPANARKGHAVDRIATSLKLYGQRKPIVVNRGQGNKIEAGNGTYRAAKSLGWTEIAAVFVDDDPATAAAYGIADNRLGDMSEWDLDALGANLATVDDLFTGFTTAEIDELIPDRKQNGEDPGPQVDKAAELQAKWQTVLGQLWQLGEHRLICGDCTDAAVVERLMGGERANLLMTSPPYWVGKDYETQKDEQEIDQFVGAFIDSSLTAMFDDFARIVINTGVGRATSLNETDTRIILLLDKYVDALLAHRWKLRTLRHWVKGGGQPRPRRPIDDVCYFGIEYLMTFYKAGAQSRGQNIVDSAWAQQSDWTDVDGDRQENQAGFSIEIPSRFIRLYTNANEIVFEPFCGNGTTLIACENLGRRCRAVDIAPGYVAVALERWTTMTGKTPVLVGGEHG